MSSNNVKDIYNDTKKAYVADAKDVLIESVSAVKETSELVRDDMRDIAHRAGQNLREFFDMRKEEVISTAEVCTKAIRNKPVQSSLIALGVGLAIGSLLRRR